MNKRRLHIALFVMLVGFFANDARSQSVPDSAESKFPHPPEWSAFAGVGLSTLIGYFNSYRPALGGDVGGGYTYFFHPHWGIAIGASVALFRSKNTLPGITGTIQANDGTDGIAEFGGNGNFDFTYSTKDFSGQQYLLLANIPVMLQYESYVSEHNKSYKYYFKLGPKVGIPLYSKYINRVEEVQTSGTFWDTPIQSPETMGFVHKNIESKGKITTRPIAVFLSAETGFKRDMKNGNWLYTGFYIDYGIINELVTVSNALSIEYNANYPEGKDADYQFPGVIVPKTSGKNPFNSTIPISVGMRVTLAFGRKERKLKKSETSETLSPPSSSTGVPPGQVPTPTPTSTPPSTSTPTPTGRSDTTKVVPRRRTITNPARIEKMRDMKKLERPLTFEFDKSELLDTIKVILDEKIIAIKKQLDEDIRILKKYPDITIVIEGHTCDIGTEEHNMTLAKERAEAVKAYMLQNGIPTQTVVSTISKSTSEPLYPNTTEENRQKNRRAEIKIIQKLEFSY
ncbi:OmpA family protein [Candidatus Symbiothrix dinenymphae]|uniref:OmpA family protein n=1 Tax=Candidatus Symbiothrix dinenymphae TaxID=467085 RepID=UPI0006BFD2EA|nr:OmpA family protein [Candidatus Symbiothrix dinenymphae]GAP72737.1 hypothetical protein SAMD00024442_40_19 [Candidatus Symbiothrix dinenymphae]